MRKVIRVNEILVDQQAFMEEADRLRADIALASPNLTLAERDSTAIDWAIENTIERLVVRSAAACLTGRDADTLNDTDYAVLRDHVTRDLPPVSHARVHAAYEGRHAASLTPARIHAAHIVRHWGHGRTEGNLCSELGVLYHALQAGADFATLAHQHSDCPDHGGNLGVFEAGVMVPEFDAVVFALKAGQVSMPFRTVFGMHIAKTLERWPAGQLPFDACKPAIASALRAEDGETAMENWLQDRRRMARIEWA